MHTKQTRHSQPLTNLQLKSPTPLELCTSRSTLNVAREFLLQCGTETSDICGEDLAYGKQFLEDLEDGHRREEAVTQAVV
jgi:hypothetical protein